MDAWVSDGGTPPEASAWMPTFVPAVPAVSAAPVAPQPAAPETVDPAELGWTGPGPWPGPGAGTRAWAPETRRWACAAHWLPLLTHWVGPLVVLLTVGRRDEVVRVQAASSMNWEITVAVLLACAALLEPVGVVGTVVGLLTILASVILHVVGALRACAGREFLYPVALPLVR